MKRRVRNPKFLRRSPGAAAQVVTPKFAVPVPHSSGPWLIKKHLLEGGLCKDTTGQADMFVSHLTRTFYIQRLMFKFSGFHWLVVSTRYFLAGLEV
jgi:hypothetical protein